MEGAFVDVSLGGIAGLVAALIFLLFVGVVAIPLVKLGRVFGATEEVVRSIGAQTAPLLGEVTTTVSSVNSELERVDVIATNVQNVSTNVSALTSLFAATLGGPVVKVAAFSYGVRRAASGRQRHEMEQLVTQAVRAQRHADRDLRRERS
jgi:Bacterial protein of unknown function (DUF948)